MQEKPSNYMPQPTRESVLDTPRLLLRPWRETDAEALYECARNPEIGPAAGWKPHASTAESREIIRTVLSEPETYAIVLKTSGRPIGSIGAFQCRAQGAEQGEYEIGYWIGRPYWGKGFAPEAVERLLRRCFTELDCRRVWCASFDGNEKSRRVQEKCGFVFHHTETDVLWPITGEYKTEHFTCIERESRPQPE